MWNFIPTQWCELRVRGVSFQLDGVNLKSVEFHSTQWCELKKHGISCQLNGVNLKAWNFIPTQWCELKSVEFHSSSMV